MTARFSLHALLSVLILQFCIFSHPLNALADGASSVVVKIDQPILGNILFDGEPISLPITAQGADSVQWILTDSWGQNVTRGKVSLSAGGCNLYLGHLHHGLFNVHVTAMSGALAIGSSDTALAVMAPYDVSKVSDTPFGAMTHMAQGWDTDLLLPLSRAGIKNVRDEIYWDNVEQIKDLYAFPDSYERYQSALKTAGMAPLTPLDFDNPLYDKVPGLLNYQIAPWTNQGFDGYAHYCSAVVKHYGSQSKYVEIWNEYNGGFAQGPADGRPEVYRAMLKRAYAAIKHDRPDVTVVAGGTIGIPLDWFETVFKDGGIDSCDGISVHPYGYTSPPETFVPKLEALRSLIRKYNHGHDKPIWVTEMGYFTSAPGQYGNREPISEITKAHQLVRSWTLFLAHGVDKAFWYLSRDDSSFGTMGLMGDPNDPDGKYAPKPAIVAYGVLIRELTGATFKQRDDLKSATTYSYQFVHGKDTIRVMWATTPVDVAIASISPVAVTDMFGVERQIFPVGGKVHLHLSEAPIYAVGAFHSLVPDGDRMTLPAQIADDEQMPVTLDTRGLAATSVRAGDLEVPAAADKVVKIVTPSANNDGEHWTTLEAMSKGHIVYFGAQRSLVVAPLALDAFPRLSSADKMDIRITNSSTTRGINLSSVTWSVAGKERTEAIFKTLAATQSLTVPLPIDPIPAFTIRPAVVTLQADGETPLVAKADVSYTPILNRTIHVDGDLSDWSGVPAIDLSSCPYVKLLAPRTGDADLSGTARLAWDDGNLYFGADVTDDVFDQTHTGYTTWKGDNFQLGISTTMPWASGDWGDGCHEIGLSLTPKGPELYQYGGPGPGGPIIGGTLIVKRVGVHTIYECAIPWSAISSVGLPHAIGFGLFLNDADGSGRKGYLQWADIKEQDKMQPCVLVHRP